MYLKYSFCISIGLLLCNKGIHITIITFSFLLYKFIFVRYCASKADWTPDVTFLNIGLENVNNLCCKSH